mgnify:CR=1 FL=1|tara:strand:+ start:237 stop:1103 length:867 start_codon:yes stop_codon:yes gene_type:complete
MSENKQRHILITGGTGLVGEHIKKHLSNIDYKITSVSRSFSEKRNHFSIDLLNKEMVKEFIDSLDKIDVIIHCAAIAHGERPPSGLNIADFNSSILINLLEAFKKNQPHWIFMSSVAVYGDMHSNKAIPIIQNPIPFDDYGLGKIRDENELIRNCPHLDILRLTPVYDMQNLDDIKKRVFIPKTNFIISIFPSPKHSICHLNQISTFINKCLKDYPGQRFSQVADQSPIRQKELIRFFVGTKIYIPKLFINLVFYLLPKRFAHTRKAAFMLKKFGLSNIYQVGRQQIN